MSDHPLLKRGLVGVNLCGQPGKRKKKYSKGAIDRFPNRPNREREREIEGTLGRLYPTDLRPPKLVRFQNSVNQSWY